MLGASKKNMKYPRLFVGPMSKEIVDIAIQYSRDKRTLGLIPSRRQIEYSGGYVNSWTTDEFSFYVKSATTDVLLVRDHGGPNQGEWEDDGRRSFEADVECGFDILHIDPWKTCNTIQEGVEKTAQLIDFCYNKRPEIVFEVGTEESIFPYTPQELESMLRALSIQLGSKFSQVKFAVVQSGVAISGTSNVGKFNAQRLDEMIDVVKNYSLLSKEHNGDYLSSDQICARAEIGLDSINIAPEFGVMQTKLLLDGDSIDTERALATCVQTGKHHKWIPDEFKDDPPDDMIILVSGHYSFTKPPFASVVRGSMAALKVKMYDRFDEIHRAWSR